MSELEPQEDTKEITELDPQNDTKKIAEKEKRAWLLKVVKHRGWAKLKRDIIKYNIMRERVIQENENDPSPTFQYYLTQYKAKLSRKEYERNRLKIYALCNKHAMFHCLSVDEMLKQVTIFCESSDSE